MPVHILLITQDNGFKNDVAVSDRPTKSPGMNVVRNTCPALAVYIQRAYCQLDYLSDLREALIHVLEMCRRSTSMAWLRL